MKKQLLLISLLLGSLMASAQIEYRHSLGVSLGSQEGLSYKVFSRNHYGMAFQLDLGYSFTATQGFTYYSVNPDLDFVLKLDPIGTIKMYNFDLDLYWMQQRTAVEVSAGDLDWFAGGGFSLGSWIGPAWRFGFGPVGGVEWKFANAPVNFAAEFRPGVSLYTQYTNMEEGRYVDFMPYFDWSLNLTVRFRIGGDSGERHVSEKPKSERSSRSSSSSSVDSPFESSSSSFGGSEEPNSTESKPTPEPEPEKKKHDEIPESTSYSF